MITPPDFKKEVFYEGRLIISNFIFNKINYFFEKLENEIKAYDDTIFSKSKKELIKKNKNKFLDSFI